MNRVLPASLTVLITGGTAGIGEACVRRFISEGSKVIVTGRRQARLESLKEELGDNLYTVNADVRDTAKMNSELDSLPEEFKGVNVLVNNAGLALGLEKADKGNLEDWNTMIDTNIKALLATTHYFLPKFVAQDVGHVINIGSVAGTYPYPGGNVYGGTKAFVQQFSLNLRADLLGKNIRVTNIEPGMVETEFSIVRFGGKEDAAKKVYENVQPMTGDDIAETVFWTATLPRHLNINTLECMPTMQAFGPFAVHRDGN